MIEEEEWADILRRSQPRDAIEQEAIARHEAHVNHPTHRPLSDGYEEVGLRGEDALTAYFPGLQIDMTRRPNGDGGIDNILCLNNIDFIVDVKCARKPGNLIVEVGKVKPRTIYILAGYNDEMKKAELLRWQWGYLLLQAPTRDFGYGVINHYIPFHKLRPMEELRKRYTPKGVALRDPPIYRCETCGLVAHYGYGVSLRQDKKGKWYCHLHRPVVAERA